MALNAITWRQIMAKIKPIEHKPLHCPICGKRFMNIYGKPLPNHAQVRVNTTAGNEMDLGICDACTQGVTMETLQAVLEGIKIWWCAEIDADKDLKKGDKDKRKAFHNSHQIESVKQFVGTGKRAEIEARKKGDLK